MTWPTITGVAIRLYIWPKIIHWFICPPAIFWRCLVGPSSNHSKLFSRGFLPMVLPWWKIWCPPYLYDYRSPWWMVYFPYWTLIPLLFFRASLDSHKKANSESNYSLVQLSPELYIITLFWILISGIYHHFCLTSTASLLLQCLMCKIFCEITFVVHLPVSQYPLRYQDLKNISLSKQSWVYSLKCIQGLLYFWSTLPRPLWW